MEKNYAFKPFHKYSSLGLFLVSGIAAILNFLVGEPIAFVLLLAALMGFFQTRHYSKPYVTIEHGVIYIRATFLKTFTFNVSEVENMEQKKNHLLFILNDKSKRSILFNFLKKEDKAELCEDFLALIEGEDPSNAALSKHLVD